MSDMTLNLIKFPDLKILQDKQNDTSLAKQLIAHKRNTNTKENVRYISKSLIYTGVMAHIRVSA